MAEAEIGKHYNRFFVDIALRQGPGDYLVKTRIPRSVTCPDLAHSSVSDFTLSLMQSAASAALNEFPEDYRQVLFLSHKARYLDQDQSQMGLHCSLRSPRSGTLRVLSIHAEAEGIFESQIMGGIVKEAPEPVIEEHEPQGVKVSPGQISEILSIYSGVNQSNVVEVAFDSTEEVFEATVHFPPYSESGTINDHVSARQMIEALMKVSFCGAAQLASLGRLPISYQELFAKRLDFRTMEHDIRYRKLLAPGTQSLLRFQLSSIGENEAVVNFSHRAGASKEEESFATGRMTFYLPG